MTSIGVIVTTWNTLNFLKPMVETIRTKHPYKLIIVDNASVDGVEEWVKSRRRGKCIFYKQETQEGEGRNRNVGMKLAHELGVTHIILSQEDVLLHKDCIDNLVLELERHKNWLMACAWAVMPWDMPKEWATVTAPLRGLYSMAYVDPDMSKGNLDELLEHSHEAVAALDNITPRGANATPVPIVACVRSDFVDRVGYYDGGFTEVGYDDADLMHRCGLAAGHWEIRWATQRALYFHWGGGSLFNNGIKLLPIREPIMQANEQRYIKKWGGKVLQEKFSTPIPQPSLWDTKYTYPKATRKLKTKEGLYR